MKTTGLISTREQRPNNTRTGSNGTREEWRPGVTAWAQCGSTHTWIFIVEIAPGAISPTGVRKYNLIFLSFFFFAPWCHLSDGCHLTHDDGISSPQVYVNEY